MKATDFLRMKTLIDLEPSTTRSKNSPQIKALFQSGHKRANSETSQTFSTRHPAPGLFSALHSTKKRQEQNTERAVPNVSSSIQSRRHTRQNSEMANKENVSIAKGRMNAGPNLREARIFKIKEQFDRVLKKKQAFKRHTFLTEEDISAVLNGMGVMQTSNKYFKEFRDSVVEMLKVGCKKLLAVNFFLIVLALTGIHLSRKQLDTIVLGSYDRDRSGVMELDKLQVDNIAETYQEVMGRASKQPARRPLQCIQVSITLSDDRKELMLFEESEDYQQIAQKIMNKYAIPSEKLRNIENIVQSKLSKQKRTA